MVHNKKHIRADIVLFVFCFFASGLVSVYVGRDGSWDLRNYHYYNAYSFLNGRLTYDVAPAQIQSFHNPLLDVPFYLMMNHLMPVIYGFLVGGLQGVNIWLVYKIASSILIGLSEIRRRLLSFAAALTGYFGAANLMEIGTTFYDNVTSLFVLGALLLVVTTIREIDMEPASLLKKRVAVAGLLLGIATGLKLVVAIYALAFTACLPLLGPTWRTRVTNVIIAGVSIVLGAALSIGYWMSLLWKNFQSPLFPYYNKVFKSPYYDITNFLDDRFFPRDKYQILFYPFHFLKHSTLVSEGGFRDIRFALCYALLVLFFFMVFYKKIAGTYGGQKLVPDLKDSKRLRKITLFFMVFFVLAYILWQKMFSIYRYIIPLELLSPIFILLIMRYIFPFEKVLVRVSLGLFAFMVLTMSPIAWRKGPWTGSHFDVRVPSVQNIDHATVIMADNEPLSYIIPFFPKGTRFVSVKNNFMSPDSSNRLQEMVKKKLADNRGDLYLLSKGNSRESYEGILASYNLEMGKQKYIGLSTKFDDDLSLIPVVPVLVTTQ